MTALFLVTAAAAALHSPVLVILASAVQFAIALALVVSWCGMMRSAVAAAGLHVKCRGGVYPRSSVARQPVADEVVPWSAALSGYSPPDYTASSVNGRPWADPPIDDPNFKPNWNGLDVNVDRGSYTGKYSIEDGRPLNPVGRTGLRGRGVLGRWGPNHAADPVVTRWKIESGERVFNNDSKRPVLQFVAVKRRDNGQWALPGGMVDPGEKIAATAVREFKEEATDSLQMTDDEKSAWNKNFELFFSAGEEVYRGYMDDPRNTDNAWIETVAYNFHDENGSLLRALHLKAGDDAVGARWTDVGGHLQLYAGHRDIVQAVAALRNAHW